MNRQERRKAARERKKDVQVFRRTLDNPKERNTNERLIRQTFKEGQILNNHEWAIRLERIKSVKGIGPQLMERILVTLADPLTKEERERSRRSYESG